ncbi:rho-related BTB domain-containing protein 2, partial [Eurytemora carolleeae]|uniref:rho-related BTB domain-containing protein 2 n=1 Tax=Eurytemora carolleeae TaxID=1294199 RepID=UPI000C75D7A2
YLVWLKELVKCVLVGDNAVGKTRLICARACNQKVSLSQLLNTHVPTVWAIDQYRIYKEVLENSWVTVDGVEVSLRLWDTFGDHHKDRRFAYGRSDVVLMCFDVGRISSLENCRTMWYPQIRRFCPNTPILLVGCKNDTRFIYKDDQYLAYCKERSPLVRQVREKDLVMPDQGRAVAKELGMPYFETSVLTFFGINEVFENAIRAALMARRTQRFWMTNLKRVMSPALQEPFCPPKPALPGVVIHHSTFPQDLLHLFQVNEYLVSRLFYRLLHLDLSSDLVTRSSSETSLVSSTYGSSTLLPDFYDDTDCLIKSETSTPCHSIRSSVPRGVEQQQAKYLHPKYFPRRSSFSGLSKEDLSPRCGVSKQLNHPTFSSLQIQQCDTLNQDGKVVSSVQTVITCTKLVTPQIMNQILRFLYTGELETSHVNIGVMRQISEYMELVDLTQYLTNIINKDDFLNDDLTTKVLQSIGEQLGEIGLEQGSFSDVLFKLEDGTQAAHKPLLMSRCDMMQAMFTDDFIESSAKVVKFPGVTRFAFKELLYYLYTDRSPRVSPSNCLGVMELANRLVLPRLMNLLERRVISEMEMMYDQGEDVCEDALRILEPCQIHNADQLLEWCLSFLAQNYNSICRKFPKVLRSLHPENQANLNVNRWPPIWYLKDYDLYQRMKMERERLERPKALKRPRYRRFLNNKNNSGCLCFSSKSRRD